MFYFLSFLYGAALGSFANVVVSRLHVAPILTGRSKCLSCGHTIKWFDLIPVVSYLVLRGKCRACKHRFGISNFNVEIMYGAVFACLYHFVLLGLGLTTTSVFWLIYYSLLFVVLGIISLYDLKHKLIPVGFLAAFILLGLIMMVFRLSHEFSFVALLSPLLVPLPFFLVYLLTKGRALGFGDILVYIAVGAFFGALQGLAVLFLSVWIGASVGIVLHILNRKKYTFETGIPFVPFIAAAFTIVLFTDISILSIVALFA